MEQFLRNYYTNLNPNATEEEILAFLASQGFDVMGDFGNVGNQTVTGGILNTPNIMQGGDGGGRIPTPPGGRTGSISDIIDFIKGGGIIGSAVRGAKNLFKNFADKRAGRLDVTADAGIMPGIETGAAEGSDAGFDVGNQFDGASDKAEYDSNPTGFSGSF
tara:strand:+ start:5017 stop:5499 length:483 start_codon:yes stop_codon:yes gene_type:complete